MSAKPSRPPGPEWPVGPTAGGAAAVVFEHDGTFEGVLSAFAEASAQGLEEARFAAAGGQLQFGLWGETAFRVGTDPGRAADFLTAVRNRVSPAAAQRILHLWWAERPELVDPLYAYLRLGFRHGAGVDGYATHPAVRTVLGASRRVTGETHKFKGLLRFRELADGTLYGPMAPDANIALPLALHFRERLAAELWMIHDVGRRLAVLWNRRELATATLDVQPVTPGTAQASALVQAGAEVGLSTLVYHPREEQYQALWRAFFAAVAIPERRNPELQRRFLPRRYWEYLVERPQQG